MCSSENSSFTVIAHRGFSSQAPENTFAAFDLALQEDFDNIELDVQLSADNVAVVIHDDLVDRTTNGKGAVVELACSQLSQLDAGSWKSMEYAGQQIPKLADVLDRYVEHARLHVELKSKQELLPTVVHGLLAGRLANFKSGPFGTPGVTMTSFHLRQLQRSIELWNGNRPQHHWLCKESSMSQIDTATAAGIDGICPPATSVTSEFVQAATEAGLSVRCWGVREVDDLCRALEAGASGATVDWPDLARTYITGS